jgi:outer membrane receptor protein involved in Fe transport
MQFAQGFGLSAQWRFVGKVSHEGNSDDAALNGTTPQLGNHIPAQSYFDLAGTFTVGDHYDLRLGVNNIFDKDPPLVDSSFGSCPTGLCNGNTYVGTYDSLGRYIYAGASLRF